MAGPALGSTLVARAVLLTLSPPDSQEETQVALVKSSQDPSQFGCLLTL